MGELLAHLWPGGTWWSGFDALWPNIAASVLIGVVVYVWKIRPHLRRTKAHREFVVAQLAELHTKHDALYEQLDRGDVDG
ncbi:hypothetical protein [Actinocrispum wychmicini]|uniref:Uncharacterized protein n=1 Tax=Actinocrispum wychmicini TaxID=1213861 RepID=A0A4R2JF02_9PSEU|nr:hypothetical protein [Actinocrispum wychmicini]TCO57137.1 hypothetical protein EV192_106614 [Actinocrispum wychmicini]